MSLRQALSPSRLLSTLLRSASRSSVPSCCVAALRTVATVPPLRVIGPLGTAALEGPAPLSPAEGFVLEVRLNGRGALAPASVRLLRGGGLDPGDLL